jgi:hypothetical protein
LAFSASLAGLKSLALLNTAAFTPSLITTSKGTRGRGACLCWKGPGLEGEDEDQDEDQDQIREREAGDILVYYLLTRNRRRKETFLEMIFDLS